MDDRYKIEKKGTYKRLSGEVQVRGDYSIVREIVHTLTDKGYEVIGEPIIEIGQPNGEKLRVYRAD